MTQLRHQLLSNLAADEKTYELAGIATSVIEAGHGPPLILLHGPGTHAAKWFRVLPSLASSHRVIAPDLPGHGESRGSGILDATRTFAWLGELVERTCPTAPVIVGELAGGALAARFASRHGDRLAALILVDTFGLAAFQPPPEFMSALTAFMMTPTVETHDSLWEHCAFDLERMRAHVGDAWDVFRAYNVERASDATLQAHQEAFMQIFGLPAIAPAELEAIRVPTQLIWGRHDTATSLAIAEAASVRYQWALDVIDGAADDPAFEQPDAFVSAVRDGLSRAAWDRIAPGYDRTNTPTQMWLAEEGLRRAGLEPGMRVVDVAAGSGALSIPAARAGAHVVAIDHARVMLDLLARRAGREGLAVETRVMDAHRLELDDSTFDLAGSQFGVMLLPDLPKALREMVRVVKPGGRVLVTAYGDPHEIDFLGFFVTAVRSIRPDFDGPPSDPPPLEFQVSDPNRLRDELAAAGLVDVSVATLRETTTFKNGKALWDWTVWSNPIVEGLLAMLQVTQVERAAIQAALDVLVRERAGSQEVATLSNPVHIGTGTRRR